MSAEPSKAYSPAGLERRIYRQWLDSGAFHAVPHDPHRPTPYSIVIPPPNVTGALHLGHAINNTLQDILIRRRRMQGFNAMWMPGVDHAGIATQAVVERQIFEKEKKTRHDLGRDELVRRIWEWKEQYGNRIVEQLKLMGCSCDWQRERFTLDETCARAVREWFFRLFKDGLIFRGKRLVNWDTHLQTAVADDEVYHETVKGHLWHIRYPLLTEAEAEDAAKSGASVSPRGQQDAALWISKSTERAKAPTAAAGQDYLVVATTRPETMLADTAVAVHPEDERYVHLIGRRVLLPLTGRAIPIIADGVLVKREFGTGCVKVTPGHDPNDYACYQRHPEIGIRNMMTPDGKVDPEIGVSYAGQKMDAARKQIVTDLESLGLVEKIEDYQTDVGHSDRSKTPIQPYLSDQWFVKMGDRDEGVTLGDGAKSPGLAQAAIDAICDTDAHYESPDARKGCGKLHIFPRRYVNTYRDWLSEKRDWCISRQLWWGHRIPVWSRDCDRDSADRLTVSLDTTGVITYGESVFLINQRTGTNRVRQLACILDAENDAIAGILEENHDFERDPDVLDTWFSSALWPLSTLGWPAQSRDPGRDAPFPSRDPAFPSRDREGAVPGSPPQSQRSDSTSAPSAFPSRDRQGAVDRSASSTKRTDSAQSPATTPLAYFITFHTYGTWFRGDERGSVDRRENVPGTPVLPEDASRVQNEQGRMEGEPVTLDEKRRPIVEATLNEVASHRGWSIHALNVRSNHVHVVISGDATPERIMNDLKSFATRRMVEQGAFAADTRAWARHGSTVYLWNTESVERACAYVVERQGPDLAAALSAELPDVSESGSPLPHGRGSEIARGSDNEPEPNTLDTFYPTSVLSTAREIITLWVARMVIAGLYNDGRVPFRDVFIHPVIQDGQGRQMKKSLGNGVDPVDIIDMYGADALRFTLADMTTETQDVRIPVRKTKLPDGREVNSSEKFELGRNFCNKLWQAATGYILPNVADVEIKLFDGSRHTRAKPHELPLFDRWIRTRLNHCIDAVDEALDHYQFARAADLIRDFFWTEFCDWYLEESKLRIRGHSTFSGDAESPAQSPGHGPSDANDVKVVLLEVLDTTLCLLHPFMPFITEALWAEIGQRIPSHFELLLGDDELTRVADGHPLTTPLLINAPWPRSYEPFRAEICDRHIGDVIQPIVTALRQARTDINIVRAQSSQPAIKSLPRAFLRAGAETCAIARENLALIQRLGSTDALEFGDAIAKPPRVRSHVESLFELYVPLEGLIDLATEQKRLAADLAEKQAALDRANAQLANEGFVTRAAPQAVDQMRQRAAELERQCTLIRGHLADLE